MKQTILVLIAAFAFTIHGFSQENCEVLHHCKLQSVDGDDPTSYVIIDGENHTEYMNDEKFYIKSKLDWTDECSYRMTIVEMYYPGFPFGPGETMIVKIDKIKGDKVYLTGTVRGKAFESKYKIVK